MPPIRIVHTADNHLGLQYTSRRYTDDLRKRLINERFEALERVVATATARRAHLLVVAGDLFDSVGVAKRDIDRAAAILRGFGGIHLIILPGNHDFYEPGEAKLWGKFRQAIGDRGILLDRPEPVRLSVEDRDLVLYPGPCTSKTSTENAIGWVTAVAKDPGAVHIGIAHGCVRGISPEGDDAYYTMGEDELRNAGVDFWLLGHTHLRYPREEKGAVALFLFPSTHTPDGFDCDHEGYVWSLEIGEDKRVTRESIRTGQYRFTTWSRTLTDATELERILQECAGLQGARTLLKLSLTGRLSEEELHAIEPFRVRLSEMLAYLELNVDDVAVKIDKEYIEKHYSAGSLPSRLLLALADADDDDLALHLAHGLIQEAKR